MKRLTLKLLATALCGAILLAFGAASAEAQKLVVTVTNSTDAPVFTAFGAISGGGESDGDFSKGWFKVDPGQTKKIAVCDYSPVYEYFYYAESKSKKRYWHGKGRPGGSDFWVHPTSAFKIHPDSKAPSGYKRYVFRHLSESQGKARLNFTAR